MSKPSPRWIARLGPIFSALLGLALSGDAWARVGGGESYSGSGEGDFGGGGDGDGVAIELLVRGLFWLVFNHPVIGIPVTIGVIIAVIALRSSAGNASTRKAIERFDAQVNTRVSAAAAAGWVQALKAKDPDFELLPFLDRVQTLWREVQEAWFLRDLSPARRHLSDGTYQRLSTQTELLRLAGVRDAIAAMEVADLSLVGLESSESFDTLHVRVRARGRDIEVPAAATDAAAREAAAASPLEDFIEVWSFARRRDTRTVANAAACPNCGAVWDGGATNVCGHCQAVVNSGVYDWTLVEITQGVEHAPHAPTPEGLAAVKAQDPAFHTEGLEDRTSLCFWRWVEAQVAARPDALVRLASADFVAQTRAGLDALAARGLRRTALDCAVGAVQVCRLEPGPARWLAHVEVRFSARWGTAPSGAPPPRLPISPSRWVFTLERASGAKTDPGRGVSSACCPNCGAPLGESTAPRCEYCSAPLGAGDKDWVLTRAAPWETWAASPRAARPHGSAGAGADRGERQRLLFAMAQLAALDGAVDARERKHLQQCAARWGLPESALDVALSPEARGVGPAEPLKKGSPEAEAFLSELVQLALIDGKVDGNEKKMLSLVAGHLGLAPRLGSLLKQPRS